MLRTFVAAALGMGLALSGCEILLRFLPVQNGVFAGSPSADWQVHHLVANASYTFSDAWNLINVHRGVTNNMGYVAPFDYVPGMPGIAVIGDSFIEGLMNRYEDTLQGQLARRLPPDDPVLNFGTSGASLPDYIGLGSMVSQRFRLRWAIVLVVRGDFVEGFATAPGYFSWRAGRTPPVLLTPQPEPSRTAKFLRTLAIVRYTRGNLKLDLHHLLHSSVKGAPGACGPEALLSGDQELIDAFADDLPQAYGLPPSRVVLVFDADRQELYRSNGRNATTTCPTRDSLARAALAAAARLRGEHVIEMAPIFAAYFRDTHERVDYSPADWHWNQAGNRLAATEVARVMDEAITGSHLDSQANVTQH